MKQMSEKIINGHGNNGDWKNKKITRLWFET